MEAVPEPSTSSSSMINRESPPHVTFEKNNQPDDQNISARNKVTNTQSSGIAPSTYTSQREVTPQSIQDDEKKLTKHQGTIHGTSLSSAIAYICSIFGLNHGVCWLNATCVYAAKIKLNYCGTN